MNTKIQEIRDPKTHRLFGIYYQEKGIYEDKQKQRSMKIKLPPDTPIEFLFTDIDPVA